MRNKYLIYYKIPSKMVCGNSEHVSADEQGSIDVNQIRNEVAKVAHCSKNEVIIKNIMLLSWV